MKLTVFGATGGIGGQIVRQALDAGHQVTAVIRDSSQLDLVHRALDVVTADVTDPESIRPAIAGRDAVLSGLGPRNRKAGGITTAATRAILTAMDLEGVRRLTLVSARPVGPDPAGESLLNRAIALPLLRAILRDVYADLTAAEALMERSGAEWTAVRPPRLTNGPLTGTYRTVAGGNAPHARSISRADVAHAMLATLTDPATIKQPVGVAV